MREIFENAAEKNLITIEYQLKKDQFNKSANMDEA